MAETNEAEKTESQLTAEENIEKMKEEALKKAKEDPSVTLDPAKLIPLVATFLGLSPPSLDEAALQLLTLFVGEERIKEAKEKGELDKLMSDFLLGISAIIMTTISMISLIPLPNLEVIKMVLKIIQDFEAAKKGQTDNNDQNESII